MNNSNATMLKKEYQKFIKFLDNKNSLSFPLNKNEIEKIITINEEIWRFVRCNVKALMSIENKIHRYEISIVLEKICNEREIKIIKTFFSK